MSPLKRLVKAVKRGKRERPAEVDETLVLIINGRPQQRLQVIRNKLARFMHDSLIQEAALAGRRHWSLISHVPPKFVIYAPVSLLAASR